MTFDLDREAAEARARIAARKPVGPKTILERLREATENSAPDQVRVPDKVEHQPAMKVGSGGGRLCPMPTPRVAQCNVDEEFKVFLRALADPANYREVIGEVRRTDNRFVRDSIKAREDDEAAHIARMNERRKNAMKIDAIYTPFRLRKGPSDVRVAGLAKSFF